MSAQTTSGVSTTRLGAINQIASDFGALITTVVSVISGIVLFWKEILALWNESSLLVGIAVFGVIGLLTVFAVYAQLIGPWLERRRRQRVIDLVRTDGPPKPVSFRLRPYEEADHEDYSRPDGAHERASRWLENEEAACLYLTGSSGTGKSSLLQAWLIPELAAGRRQVRSIVVRSYADPVGQLVEALKAHGAMPIDLPEEETDPRVLLERAADMMRVRNGRLLIAIDQFEECLILQDDRAKARLAALFRDLQERPIKRLQLLFVLRSDYLKFDELAALGLPDPRPRENWFILDEFSHADARVILRRSLPGMAPALEDKVIEEASDIDDTPGLIRPITLNMMGLILKNFAGAALTRATPGRLIQDFLRHAMNKAGIDQLAPQLLAEMITDKGTKKPMAEAALAEAAGVEPMLVRKALYLLSEEGVVRELDRSRNVWEISHDFVARQLGQIIPRLTPSWWQRTQKAATPIALAAWCLILFAGYPTYQAWRDAAIAKTLRVEGVGVSGEQGAYRVVIDKDTKVGAIERVFPHIETLQPVSLIIDDDNAIERLPSFAGLQSLEKLEIWHSDKVTAIEGLEHLKRLERLLIEGNDGLIAIDGLDGLTALRKIHIEGNDGIADLNGLGGLGQLEELRLEGSLVADLDGLQGLTQLRVLDLSDNPELTSLPSLRTLENLRELTLYKNEELVTVTGLDGLKNLENLLIYKNDSLESVQGLNGLEMLKSLTVRFNERLAIRDGFEGLTGLEAFHAEDNRGPLALSPLESSRNLKKVLIWGNELLDIPRFGSFEKLEGIAVDGGDIAASIDALKSVEPSVRIEASQRYVNTGYTERLNAVRRELGLEQLRVFVNGQL